MFIDFSPDVGHRTAQRPNAMTRAVEVAAASVIPCRIDEDGFKKHRSSLSMK